MILRILLMFFAFILAINIVIIAFCYIKGENLYKKYGKQMLIAFGGFIFLVVAIYFAIALIALG